MVSPFGPPDSNITFTFGNGNRLESPISCLLFGRQHIGLDRMTKVFSLVAGCTLLTFYKYKKLIVVCTLPLRLPYNLNIYIFSKGILYLPFMLP